MALKTIEINGMDVGFVVCDGCGYREQEEDYIEDMWLTTTTTGHICGDCIDEIRSAYEG